MVPCASSQRPTTASASRAPFLARGRGGEVAQPGEALQLLGERAGGADRGEIEVLERKRLAADGEAAGEQGVAARAVAWTWSRGTATSLSGWRERLQPGKEGAARELADDRALGGRTVALIRSPLSALILSA